MPDKRCRAHSSWRCLFFVIVFVCLSGGFCLFLNKGEAALLSGHLFPLQGPPLWQAALPCNSCSSHSSHTSKALVSSLLQKLRLLLELTGLCRHCWSVLPQQKAAEKNLSKFKVQAKKKADGILLDARPVFVLPLMLLIRLFLGLSCRALVPLQDRLPSAEFTRHILRYIYARFSSFRCITNMGLLT